MPPVHAKSGMQSFAAPSTVDKEFASLGQAEGSLLPFHRAKPCAYCFLESVFPSGDSAFFPLGAQLLRLFHARQAERLPNAGYKG